MEEEKFFVGIEKVTEHEDGSATYTFSMDNDATGALAKIGLEFVVRCAAYELDMQDALDSLSSYKKKQDGNS